MPLTILRSASTRSYDLDPQPGTVRAMSALTGKDAQLEALKKKAEAEEEAKKKVEPDFAKSWYAQLDWLHKRSANYEKAHLQYPVYRMK